MRLTPSRLTLRSLVGKIQQFLKGFWRNLRTAMFRQKYLRGRMEEKYGVKISEVMIERAIRELKSMGFLKTVPRGRKGCIFLPAYEGDREGDREGDSGNPSILLKAEVKTGSAAPPSQPVTYQGQTKEEYIEHRMQLSQKKIACAHHPAAYVSKLLQVFEADFHAAVRKPPTRVEKERQIDWVDFERGRRIFQALRTA
jgi:hypothetical protein